VAIRDPERLRHWQAVLTQWQKSGQTISAFCRQVRVHELAKMTAGRGCCEFTFCEDTPG
jgi:hypothetical protein